MRSRPSSLAIGDETRGGEPGARGTGPALPLSPRLHLWRLGGPKLRGTRHGPGGKSRAQLHTGTELGALVEETAPPLKLPRGLRGQGGIAKREVRPFPPAYSRFSSIVRAGLLLHSLAGLAGSSGVSSGWAGLEGEAADPSSPHFPQPEEGWSVMIQLSPGSFAS